MGDFYNLCRLCLKNSHLFCNIFEECMLNNILVKEIINDIYELDISSNDGLPEFVCIGCLLNVKVFVTLRMEVHKVRSAFILLKKKLETINFGPNLLKYEVLPFVCDVDVKDEVFDSQESTEALKEISAYASKISKALSLTGSTIKEESITPEDIESREYENTSTAVEGTSSNDVKLSVDVAESETFVKEELEEDDFPELRLESDEEEVGSVKEYGENSLCRDQSSETHASVHTKESIQESEGSCAASGECDDNPFNEDPLEDNFPELRLELDEEEVGSVEEFGKNSFGGDQSSKTHSSVHTEERNNEGEASKLSQDIKVPDIPDSKERRKGDGSSTTPLRRECTKILGKRHSKRNSSKEQLEISQNYRCLHCDKSFSSSGSLARHKKIHMGEKPFGCSDCGKRFITKTQLIGHFRVHTVDKAFQCHLCQNKFSQKGNLTAHLRVHTVSKPYQCHLCDQKFSRKDNLDAHIRVHSGSKPFQCHLCEQTFRHKNTLVAHLGVHTGNKHFRCFSCDKAFSQKSNLTSHLRVHTGSKPYTCHLCEQKFSRKDNLNAHVRVHSGSKPFQCFSCDKTFSKKGNLTAHLRIHTGSQPYKCLLCEQTFCHKSTLVAHLRVHTGNISFLCVLCDKTFSQKSNLTAHLRLHSGSKPYQCHLCEQKFSRKDYLNAHIRVHTGSKPFRCFSCDKAFSQKSILNVHLRVHTGSKP